MRTFPYGTPRNVLRLCCEKWNGNGSVTYPLAPFLKEGGMVMGRLHWDCDDAGGSGPGIEGTCLRSAPRAAGRSCPRSAVDGYAGRPAGRPYENLTDRDVDIAVFRADVLFVGACLLTHARQATLVVARLVAVSGFPLCLRESVRARFSRLFSLSPCGREGLPAPKPARQAGRGERTPKGGETAEGRREKKPLPVYSSDLPAASEEARYGIRSLPSPVLRLPAFG